MQNPAETIRVKLPIFHKIAAYVVILIFATVGISTWIAIRTQTKVLTEQLVSQGRNLAENISFGAQKAFWSLNWVFVEELLTHSIESGSAVVCAKIIKPNGEIYMAADRSSYGEQVDTSWLVEQESLINHHCEKHHAKELILIHPTVIGEEKWTIAVGLSSGPINAAIERLVVQNLMCGGILALLAVAASLLLARTFARPIIHLTQSAKIISSGDLTHRVTIETKDEVGLLADAFNNMTGNLQQTTTSIENLHREIAERKKAEQRQTQLLEELGRTNQELRDFAYIVSHDLKAPLRGIKILVKWLVKDNTDNLDKKSRQNMNLLTRRVERMQNLINGILQYSRTGHVREEMVNVDLNELVQDIVESLAPPETIKVTIENSLPTIHAEPTKLLQIFQNLLSNAIKYMDKPQGRIRVNAIPHEDHWEFSVADNGPGIAKEHFETVFQMFQTLVPKDQYESTGVGLTVVKKIIEMYDGRIWLTSQPGEGTTFHFTLPVRQAQFADSHTEQKVSS